MDNLHFRPTPFNNEFHYRNSTSSMTVKYAALCKVSRPSVILYTKKIRDRSTAQRQTQKLSKNIVKKLIFSLLKDLTPQSKEIHCQQFLR